MSSRIASRRWLGFDRTLGIPAAVADAFNDLTYGYGHLLSTG
jgi:hypothetical protein